MKVINLNSLNQSKVIKTAVDTLKNNGLIVYPSETCFGLGADATNKKAVEKVFLFKGERNKPVSVAVDSQKMAEKYVTLNQSARNLYQNFLPGALTVVSFSKGKVVKKLESSRKTLGVRIPDHSFTVKLIKTFGKPITATSANISNGLPPYSLKTFQKYTSKKTQQLINLFINPGDLQERETSTVVDTTLNELKILRQGQIDLRQKLVAKFISVSEAETKKLAQRLTLKYRDLKRPLIFALQGELGVGKTQFAKGVAEALKIKEPVTSPTFNLIKEYPFKGNSQSNIFYHLDTWRLEDGREIIDLGWEGMLKNGNLIAVEWLEKIKTILENAAVDHSAKIIWAKIIEIGINKRQILIYE